MKKGDAMKRVLGCAMLVMLVAGAACAQDRIEVFGGYSYERLQNTGSVTNLNLNGWNAALTFKHHWIGVTGDLSGLYGSTTVAGISLHQRQHNFLAGPQVSMHLWKLDPFAHALFGVSRLRQESGAASSTVTPFAYALGGGLDLGVWPHLAIRLGQVDYFRTNFGHDSQNNVRISVGAVAHF
jgi:opacity protein-like surface antigen